MYGDPEDGDFVASRLQPPTAGELGEALVIALEAGNYDAAELMREELVRLAGGPMRGTTRQLCYGSKAGLWRLQ
jgi:hypothetical protein